MNTKFDLTGKKFGRLSVLELYGKYRRKLIWVCQCDCGNKTVVTGVDLRNGHTKSCGCLSREKASTRLKIHGQRNTRIYRIWANMKCRCLNPNLPQYKDYGGRGITICDEWLNFRSFYDWAMSSGYKNNLMIERINNDIGYLPNNCKWASRKEQNNNKRPSECKWKDNERFNLSKAAREHGLKQVTVWKRLQKGWSLEKALTTPVMR